MSMFFTADTHLNQENIFKYAKRPFRDVDHMNLRILSNINARCHSDDVLVSIGDFICYGNERGVPGRRDKPEVFEAQINAQVMHILGNHDANNHIRHAFNSAKLRIAKKTWLLVHVPPLHIPAEELETLCDAVLCGHVHTAWRTKWHGNVLMINVGVDVNKFYPLSKRDVASIYAQERSKRDNSTNGKVKTISKEQTGDQQTVITEPRVAKKSDSE